VKPRNFSSGSDLPVLALPFTRATELVTPARSIARLHPPGRIHAMSYGAVLRCLAGCPDPHPLEALYYTCPRCGDLLEVEHDEASLGRTSAADWRALFDERHRLRAHALSGVWSKREWVLPTIEDDSIVSLQEGATPLVPVPALAGRFGLGHLWIKQCGASHTGSFKDLGMTVLVSLVNQMVRRGQGVRAVACASTGDTSAALAAYAAAAGLPAVVLLPRGKISMAQLVQPLANGALVLALDTDFDGCMHVVQQLAQTGEVYLANSMNSLRLEGQKTVGIEITQQLGWRPPDVVVIPGGNLGNVSALGAGFRLMERLGLVERRPRIVVAQAQAANPLYRAYRNGWRYEPVVAEATAASAIRIGNPVSIRKAIRTLQSHRGVVAQASEAELADACAVADRHGLFTCPQTGVALAAVRALAADGTLGPDEQVVVISTANGLKFADFKRAFHEGTAAGAGDALVNRPVELPADIGEVRRAIASRLD
jgi:threonine synthase